jgi:integrase/recombinase XerD
VSLLDVVTSSTRLRPTTRSTYATSIGLFEAFAAGRPLTGALVEQWRDARLADDVSAATVYRDLAAIRFASRRAAALGLAPIDFAAPAEFPARPPWTPGDALTVDECIRIEALCARDPSPAGLRDLALFRVGTRVGGPRRTELRTLTAASYRPPFLALDRKGGWTQQVVADAATAEALGAWLSWYSGQGDDPLFISLRRSVSDEWVRGPGISGGGIASIVAGRARQAAVRRRVTPHVLRHTFVSLALAAGVPAHLVMIAAGHKSLNTTSRYVADARSDSPPIGDAIAGLFTSNASSPPRRFT